MNTLKGFRVSYRTEGQGYISQPGKGLKLGLERLQDPRHVLHCVICISFCFTALVFFFVCFSAEWFVVMLGPHDNLCPKLLLLYFSPAFLKKIEYDLYMLE